MAIKMIGGQPVNYFDPVLPVQAMKTYTLGTSRALFKDVSCSRAECSAFWDGWKTIVDESTSLGKRQAAWIRGGSGRAFTESRDESLTVFTFPPGQSGFSHTHRERLDHADIFRVTGGDWRGNLGLIRAHRNADDFVDDFANHQDGIASAKQKG